MDYFTVYLNDPYQVVRLMDLYHIAMLLLRIHKLQSHLNHPQYSPTN